MRAYTVSDFSNSVVTSSWNFLLTASWARTPYFVEWLTQDHPKNVSSFCTLQVLFAITQRREIATRLDILVKNLVNSNIYFPYLNSQPSTQAPLYPSIHPFTHPSTPTSIHPPVGPSDHWLLIMTKPLSCLHWYFLKNIPTLVFRCRRSVFPMP